MRPWLSLSNVLSTSLLVAAVSSACVVPNDLNAELARARSLAQEGPTELTDTLSPAVARHEQALARRLEAIHRRHGRARPPATDLMLGELGAGAQQAFRASLRAPRCYTVLAVGLSNDQEIDLLLLDESGQELDADRRSTAWAAIEICPPAQEQIMIVVRMYRGQGPFALRVYGS